MAPTSTNLNADFITFGRVPATIQKRILQVGGKTPEALHFENPPADVQLAV
jgi:hypothetical protein